MDPGEARSYQTAVCQVKPENSCHISDDRSNDHQRIHQDIREINLMNTTKYMDDHSTRCGLFCLFIFAKEHICQQHTKTRARVRLQHIHNGFSCFCCLCCCQRSENSMIDRIVQEQYLCRLNKDCKQRKQAVAYQNIDTSCQNSQNATHHRTYNHIPQDCQQHSDDTC